MSDTYDFEFGEETPYGRAYGLVLEFAEPGGVVVDLGCGHGALGQPLTDAGFEYIGFDVDAQALEHVRERGHETAIADLTDFDSLLPSILTAVGDRPVRAILALDVVEHLPVPDGFLASLRTASVELGRPPLVVSVPNVAHFDIGAKLLHGRWEITDSGLLDRTHLAWFTDASLTKTLGAHGWVEVARADLKLDQSDQHFPSTHPGIAMGSSTASYLRDIRNRVDGFGTVNQFVRAYSCGDVTPQRPVSEPQDLGLSVIVRTQGNRPDLLSETLLSLAGQDTDDFEVLLMVHSLEQTAADDTKQLLGPFAPSFSRRVEIRSVVGGDRSRPLNEGLERAQGKLVAFLDDDDVVTANWVSTFTRKAVEHPGTVIRTITADQEVRRTDSPPGYEPLSGADVDPARIPFSIVRHFETNRTPICAFAVPMETVRTYSLEFDESLPVLEDWHFFLRAARICGVHNVRKVTSIYRRWDDEEASWHSIDTDVWNSTLQRIQLELDGSQLVLPKGSATEIVHLIKAVYDKNAPNRSAAKNMKQVQRELNAANRRISALENSTSWRITAPLRAVTSLFKPKPPAA